MKNKILILFIAVSFSVKGFAQLGTPLSQFSGNQMVYNPGYAGLYDLFAINLSAQKSWMNLPGSPRIINLNGHTPFGVDDKHAWGWIFHNEGWGALTGNFILGNYAYKMFLGEGLLSFGVQAGILVHSVNWNKIDHMSSWEDPVYLAGKENRHTTKFDANVGVYYLTEQYYLGLSVMHLNNPKYGAIVVDGVDWYSQMRSQFIVMGGYNYEIDRTWAVRPEIFLRYIHTTPLSANIGVHGYYMDNYSFGVNFMTGQKGVSLQVKGNFFPNMRVGYSYNLYFGSMRHFQSGTHEISVNYSIWRQDQGRTPFDMF